ncbi:DNA methyltransferase [Gulosibacter bifidus]|uniref:DNA methyltransferase n=1 Tax=Gulosibacter bifidus TaxID=272239 RepID=A0ABW5RIE9_9MICO|nr:site-specific DNA-methyltransferase [Gulosibacter bifidus]
MNFLQELEAVLKSDERFVSQDGQLLKPRVRDAVSQLDATLIRSLAAAPILKEHFFKIVDGITIFDQEKFMWVVNSKEFLPDSYTAYRNKIGLSANDHDLISASSEVTLVWPYKDCVLEGGQDKEDERRDEVFYNETLAPDEVARLLAPKAFCNATRYTAEGEERLTEFDENENLLIKGNNLLALSSLLERYEGQVKCIYIDPPYNTGSDSFGYNDRFSRSSWLVFMKNRLELARKLLSQDGVILIQCSFHQYPYLRVVADEIFSEQCHQFDMNTLVRHPDRSLTGDKRFNDVVEYTLIYSKSPSFEVPKREIKKTTDDYQYDFEFLGEPNDQLTLAGKSVKVYFPDRVQKTRSVGHAGGLKSMSIRGSIREKNSSGRFYVAHLEPFIDKYPKGTVFAVPNMGDDGRDFRIFELPQGNNKNGFYYPGQPLSSDVTLKPYPNFVDFVKEYNIVNSEGGVSFRNGKKPEAYIQFYLEMFSQPGHLVMDFHLGSGTTAAVAHKLGRRYIGVEQMEYIQTITVPRLRAVIDGEQSGVSKAHNWKGGGSFVYVELAEQGEELMRRLEDAHGTADVAAVLDRATERGLLRPSVLPSELKGTATDFESLTVERQRQIVAELIDKNRLYINASDVDDEELGLSEGDIAFTKSFYKKGE